MANVLGAKAMAALQGLAAVLGLDYGKDRLRAQ
jgi:hypothetical protein